MFWPCETRTSTCRNFATISSGVYRFFGIAVLLHVKRHSSGRTTSKGEDQQPFRLQRLLYLWPRVHALHEGFDIREGREVEFDAWCPTRHRVKIGISYRELVTHQVLLTFKHLVDVLVVVRERLLGNLLVLVWGGWAEHRSVGLVQLGSDMGEPALKVIAIDGACGRDDASPRVLVGDVLYDRRALADHLPVVELEQRNLALWVDRPIIVAFLGLFLAQIDLLQVELGPRLP